MSNASRAYDDREGRIIAEQLFLKHYPEILTTSLASHQSLQRDALYMQQGRVKLPYPVLQASRMSSAGKAVSSLTI